jgi:hypothetical protein
MCLQIKCWHLWSWLSDCVMLSNKTMILCLFKWLSSYYKLFSCWFYQYIKHTHFNYNEIKVYFQ